MPSLASLAKKVVLANRITRNASSDSGTSLSQASVNFCYPTVPLPLSITKRIPQELYERVIEHLYDDRAALACCGLVCRAWWPACRYRIRMSMTVLPDVIVADAGALGVDCALSLCGSSYILYGSYDGVYMLDRAARAAPCRVLESPDVLQLDVLEEENLLVFLSGHQVLTHPLDALDPTEGQSITECTRVSAHVTFFKVGRQLGRPYVCVVKSSNVVKVLRPVPSPVAGRSVLRLYKEFYLPTKVTSAHFLKTKLVVGISNHGFEIVDLETLNIQALLDPTVSLRKLKTAKCLAIHPAGDEFLLCYDTFAFYVNRSGLLSRRETIRWRDPVQALTFRGPYVVAFSPAHIEVRYLETGALVQTVWIKHALLSASPELVMIQAVDGRLISLGFSDSGRASLG